MQYLVRYIQENPYVQYYLGLHEFHMEPLFDSSMMVHFRKRFPIEFVAKVNEYICTGKWPEEMRMIQGQDPAEAEVMIQFPQKQLQFQTAEP